MCSNRSEDLVAARANGRRPPTFCRTFHGKLVVVRFSVENRFRIQRNATEILANQKINKNIFSFCLVSLL